MEIKVLVSNEDKETVVEAFKLASQGYPTGDSDEKIVFDGVTAYIRAIVVEYQKAKLQEEANQAAQDIADNIVLE